MLTHIGAFTFSAAAFSLTADIFFISKADTLAQTKKEVKRMPFSSLNPLTEKSINVILYYN